MTQGKRVFFFNRFFWPDQSATAQILTDLCRDLDGRGYRVTVVTSRLDYGNKEIQYCDNELLGGVAIVRLWSTRFGRAHLLGRLLDYLSIYYSFLAYLLRNIGDGDIVVLKTDPPLLSILGAFCRIVREFRLVAWCQDVFPEVAMAEMQTSPPVNFLFRLLQGLRDWSLCRSDRVVVLGADMRDYFAGRGIESSRLACIPNWSVQDDPAETRESALRAEWGIPADCFVVGYSGNLGRAHDWMTLLEAACQLDPHEDMLFLLSGGGHGYVQLREAVESAGLSARFLFLPYQAREDLASSLRVPDLHWFTLKERLRPFIFPSKFFGILQAGRPMVYIGSTIGEIPLLINANGIGSVVAEGDAAALAEEIRRWRDSAEAREESGLAARRLWENSYQRSSEVAKWEGLLQDLGRMHN